MISKKLCFFLCSCVLMNGAYVSAAYYSSNIAREGEEEAHRPNYNTEHRGYQQNQYYNAEHRNAEGYHQNQSYNPQHNVEGYHPTYNNYEHSPYNRNQTPQVQINPSGNQGQAYAVPVPTDGSSSGQSNNPSPNYPNYPVPNYYNPPAGQGNPNPQYNSPN